MFLPPGKRTVDSRTRLEDRDLLRGYGSRNRVRRKSLKVVIGAREKRSRATGEESRESRYWRTTSNV